MNREEAKRRGLNAARGILIALFLSALVWGAAIVVVLVLR